MVFGMGLQRVSSKALLELNVPIVHQSVQRQVAEAFRKNTFQKAAIPEILSQRTTIFSSVLRHDKNAVSRARAKVDETGSEPSKA